MTSRRVTSRITVPTLMIASLLTLVAPRAQAAFTDHFDALEQELALRAVTLGASTDKTELKQAKACVKALATIAKSTTSLATDIKAAGKAAKTLQKAFPNEFTPLVAKGTITPQGGFTNLEDLLISVFEGLGDDVLTAIAQVQALIDALPAGSDKDKAQAALDQATMLINDALNSGDFATAAKLGAAALKAALKGQSIANSGGGGGGSNSLTMKVDGASWTALGVGGEYQPSTGAFDFGGASASPPSQLTLIVSSGINGPGTYSLPAGLTSYLAGTSAYLNTGGTLTITTLDTATHTATGTFSFTANPVGGGTPINITNGAFTITDLTIL